jgi:fructokinase
MNPIVGIGELLWDIYPDGRKVAGGAPFNFAFHCHQLGHPAVIVSRVGDDEPGKELRDRVRELGLSDEYIQTDHEHPTGTVKVDLDVDGMPSYTITESVAWDCIAWDSQLESLALRCRSVCFGTLGQRANCSFLAIKQFLSYAASAFRVLDFNLRPTVNRHRLLGLKLDNVDLIKLNECELRILVSYGRQRDSLADPFKIESARPMDETLPKNRVDTAFQLLAGNVEELVAALYRTMIAEKEKLVTVTQGEQGALVFGGSNRAVPIHEPGVPAKVVDTVGAGDAFTAAMVCLHLEGWPLRECARFANRYAARVCEHVGATPRIDRAEVERAAFGQ